MTFEEFRKETSNIESFYEKALNPTQVQIWFEEIKNYPVERYRQAIKKVCKTSQYKPSLSLVLETIRTTKPEQLKTEPVECKACKGSGYVLYKKIFNDLEYEYVSLCNCPNAIGKEYNGRTSKENPTDYYIPRAVDIFGVGGSK